MYICSQSYEILLKIHYVFFYLIKKIVFLNVCFFLFYDINFFVCDVELPNRSKLNRTMYIETPLLADFICAMEWIRFIKESGTTKKDLIDFPNIWGEKSNSFFPSWLIFFMLHVSVKCKWTQHLSFNEALQNCQLCSCLLKIGIICSFWRSF